MTDDGGQVGVLGAGTMAPGIAAAFAGAGHPVRLWARSAERARAAAARARELAGFLVEHRLAGALAAIEPASELEELSGAGVVVEAIAEDLVLKQDLFARVEAVVDSRALLASTTSGLRVADLAARVRQPERVVAMHFWNPAHLMPLVEVAGERASRASIERAMALARAIGKVPVLLEREVLGFLGVRLQQAVVREAIALFEAGVASAEDIDLAVRTSFGIRFPVIGPLESADLTGLDVIEAIHGYLLADLDRSTEPQAALRSRVEAGDLGSKSGRGFHDWTRRDAAATMRARDDELVRRLQLRAAEPVG